MSYPYTIYGTAKDALTVYDDKIHPYGTRMILPDGRVFRFSKNSGTAVFPGRLCAKPDADAVSTGAWYLDTASTAGSTSIIFHTSEGTSGVIAKNEYADGYMWLRSASVTGRTEVHQILQHASSTDAGDACTGCTFHLYQDDVIVNAIGTTEYFSLQHNPYSGIVVQGIAITTVSMGVAINYVAANKYFWLQTWGPCPMLKSIEATLIDGETVVGSSYAGTTGAVEDDQIVTAQSWGSFTATGAEVSGAWRMKVGVAMSPALDTTDYALVFLTLAP